MMTRVKTAAEIAAMRQSGAMLASVMGVLAKSLEPGMSSKDLANIAAKELKSLGGQPAFLGYQGFPDVLCVSVNEEVVHGIPRPDKIIENGDIVSLDFGVNYQGMITDSARTFIVGQQTDKRVHTLVDTTRLALEEGVYQVKAGCRIGDIAAAIQGVLDEAGLGIVRELVGHGVGHDLHEDPNIPNYGKAGEGMTLQAGMTIAIEPMATLGDYRVNVAEDGWTISTRDGSLAAHFEDTVLITADGAEVLTP